MEEDSYLVVIEGGSPWGFGIQGGLDFRSPLRVKMVTPSGRAHKSGLVTGDYITAINGQETKPLKHMQAMQLIKKSTQKVELTCIKMRPGLISPATNSSFSFPSRVANGTVPKPPVSRSPVISSKTLTRPAPPPVVVNGHNRQSSLGTPSESTASSSPHSCGGESYEAKFLGMDTYCIDKSHPMPDVAVPDVAVPDVAVPDVEVPEVAVPKLEVQESVDVVQVEEEPLVTYDLGKEESLPQEVIEEMAVMVEVKDELHAAYSLESLDEPSEPDQQDAPVEQTEEVINDESAVSETVEAIVMTPQDIDITCDVHNGEAPVPIVEAAEAVVMEETPIELNCDETAGEVEVKKPSRKASPSMNKMDLVNIIAHAAERKKRESRESSVDSQDPTKGQSSPEKSPQVPKKQSPKHSPKETSPKPAGGKSVMSASKPPKPVRALSIEAKEDILPVAKQPLKQTENPVAAGIKEPGWYKQMFQDFQHTVEETYPGSSSGPETEYVYDERGLKVRRDSLPRNTKPLQPEREKAPSPDDPVYVYDERGLRVRADSLSKVQSSTSPEAEKMRTEQRPKSANTPKLSMDPGVTTDDVLSANKRQTGLKANQFSTDGSRDYWNQKDQDHKEFEENKRNSQELHVRQSSSSSDYSTKMTSMHPLLQAAAQENKETPAAADGEESERVFNRIDASKLQGALDNASMLKKLEKEGVAPELLPGVAKGMQEEKNKPKEKQLKPPPGRKGKALYAFDGQTAKELSFQKGDIVDLLHTVDANWLQGSLGGAKGIFPASYIQVLSLDEYRQLISPEPKARTEVGKAMALFDFQGQSLRELSFSKDDELIIKKKIDDNWYEGYHGDKEGIFPVLYVKEL